MNKCAFKKKSSKTYDFYLVKISTYYKLGKSTKILENASS